MQWQKETITLKDGSLVEAQAPIIVSVSRTTDIPAFYAQWFMKNLQEGWKRYDIIKS